MIQDYKPSSRSLSFIRPRFSRHRSPPFSPRSDPSLLSLPGPSPYIMCLVRPVVSLSFDPPCRDDKSVQDQSSHIDVVWKSGEWRVS
ncbi:hypothetical protein TNCV_4599931 [Trichonephila clavipes]|nr:hypothetical protein TNCV_4599931 [Trichonephila clavipes]